MLIVLQSIASQLSSAKTFILILEYGLVHNPNLSIYIYIFCLKTIGAPFLKKKTDISCFNLYLLRWLSHSQENAQGLPSVQQLLSLLSRQVTAEPGASSWWVSGNGLPPCSLWHFKEGTC